jgi:hypothetical protein
MRNLSRWFVLLVVLAGLGSLASPQCNGNQNCPERRTISVNGTALVTADADLAVVRVGYKLYGADAKNAYDRATDVSNAIMSGLTASGIAQSAIESTSQVLQHTQMYDLQQFPMGSEDREHRQFTVTQSWIIRVKPDQAATALNTAVSAGANESGWIQWIVEDPSALQARASSEAVANARKIAEQIAEKAGVKLGHLVNASENRGSEAFNGPINGAMGSIFGMGDGVMMAGSASGMNQQLAINYRRVEFRTSVFAVFAIEDAAPAK